MPTRPFEIPGEEESPQVLPKSDLDAQGGSAAIPLRYVIVSPVKDEALHIRTTLDSVCAQSILPLRWVIVDDGSSDGTEELVEPYLTRHPWITLTSTRRSEGRNTGMAESAAFTTGCGLLQGVDYDVIVKLDGDLRLPPHYFSALLAEFHKDPCLGILSGVYREQGSRGWRTIRMPAYHAAGASKAYRRRCFEQIGGIPAIPGWDSADEVKAQCRGWSTRHLPDLAFDHLRAEGNAMGWRQTNMRHGEIVHRTGGSRLFFLLKVVHRIFRGRPPLLAGIFLAWGYARAVLTGSPKIVTPTEENFYRRVQLQRLIGIRGPRSPEKAP